MQPSPKSARMAALDLARAAHLALNDLMPKMALAFNGVASLGMVKETEIFLILLEIHCQVNYYDFFMMSRELKIKNQLFYFIQVSVVGRSQMA